jgi:hypothetical protein
MYKNQTTNIFEKLNISVQKSKDSTTKNAKLEEEAYKPLKRKI